MKKDNNPSPGSLGATLAVLGAVAAPVQAAPILISQTLTLDQVLSGDHTALQFNIAALLAEEGMKARDVVSGELVVYGLSDPDYGSAEAQPYSDYVVTGTSTHNYTYLVPYTYYYTYSYRCGWGRTCYASRPATGYYTAYATVTDYHETRSRDMLHRDEVADTLEVTAGGSSATDSADQTLAVTDPYGDETYESQTGGGSAPIHYYYNQERDVYEAIHGPLEVVLTLDDLALTDIRNDSVLDARVSATTGQFQLQSAVLRVLAEAAPAAVMAPGSLALLGGGLAVAAARRRRSDDQR